jgi:hypothetical protein
MFALATAYRWRGEQEAEGSTSSGWQRWGRQRREETRDKVIVLAEGVYGIFHIVEDSKLLAASSKMYRWGSARGKQSLESTGLQPMAEPYPRFSGLLSILIERGCGGSRPPLSPTPMYSARDDADSAFVTLYTIVHIYVNKNVRRWGFASVSYLLRG